VQFRFSREFRRRVSRLNFDLNDDKSDDGMLVDEAASSAVACLLVCFAVGSAA